MPDNTKTVGRSCSDSRDKWTPAIVDVSICLSEMDKVKSLPGTRASHIGSEIWQKKVFGHQIVDLQSIHFVAS